MRLVIAGPPYNVAKGGHIVVHKLCDILLRQGLDAYLKPQKPRKWAVNPDYQSRVTQEFRPGEDVAVYHDTIKGNPWGAKYIIRWLLYHPRYPVDGVVLLQNPDYLAGPVMNVIDPFLHIFYDRGQPRQGCCWTWRKAEKQGWQPSQRPKNAGLEIKRGTGLLRLAEIFNNRERFVSYDGATFMFIHAALCGCDAVVLRPAAKMIWPGLALHSPADIPRAREERPKLRPFLEAMVAKQEEIVPEMMRWAMNQF